MLPTPPLTRLPAGRLEQSIEKATQTGEQLKEGVDVESDEGGIKAEQSFSVS